MYTSFRQEELNNDYIESLKPAPFHALLGVDISSMCAVLKDLRYKNTFLPLLGEQPLFLPLSVELDGCHLFTQSLNHLLTCSLPERRCVWSQ